MQLKTYWLKNGHFILMLKAIIIDKSRKVEMDFFLVKTSLITRL
jgi:hypothetical protein